ncbi:MAG: PAS domain-containing protein, partial [Verrucomicrobiota bacterium]
MKTPAASPELNHPDVQTLRKVWELTPSVLVVTDPSGNIEYVNPAFERVTGYAAAEVLGKTPRILKSGNQGPEVYADLWRTITAGGTWTGRLQNRRKDGSLYWESLTIAPLCDGEGKILRYIAVKKDMTAEDELLLANEKRYAMTLEAVDDAVWDWNLTTGAAFFSPKYYSMLGYDVGEFPASYESWRSLVHPDDLARTEGELLRHIESGKGYGADIRMRSKSGEWIWISARGNIV